VISVTVVKVYDSGNPHSIITQMSKSGFEGNDKEGEGSSCRWEFHEGDDQNSGPIP
jgi:hypothetical protein